MNFKICIWRPPWSSASKSNFWERNEYMFNQYIKEGIYLGKA